MSIRRKVVMWGLGFFLPLAALISASEPIRKELLSKYDIRWCVTNDSNERSQTISLHNYGAAQSPPILVQAKLSSLATQSVLDFDFLPLESAPRTSFLETITQSSSLTTLVYPYSNSLMPVIDAHSKRSLFALDQILSEIRTTKLEAISGVPKNVISAFLKSGESHETWLQKCQSKKDISPACRLESVWEEWERLSVNLQTEAARRWYEATGVLVKLPDHRICPKDVIYFIVTLKGDDSCAIRVKYGLGRVELLDPLATTSATRQIARVENASDLQSAAWWLYIKEYPYWIYVFPFVVMASLWFAWHFLRPIQTRPTYQVLNIALKTNDSDFWDIAYQRQKYFLAEESRRLRDEYDRLDLQIGTEELFGYVRDQLLRQAAVTGVHFENDTQMNRVIVKHIEDLVVKA